MIAVTPTMLAAATGASRTRAVAMMDGLQDALELFGINSQLRLGMFLANVGHETGRLRYLSELWGPTPQQKRYERNFSQPWPVTESEQRRARNRDAVFQPNRLAWTLGNSEKGDGRRYCGHGFLQITGRTNHRLATQRLRARFPAMQVPDFEANPELLATSRWGWMTSAEYAERVGCFTVADEDRFDAFCDLINLGRVTAAEGDSNGYEDRLALWQEFTENGGLSAA